MRLAALSIAVSLALTLSGCDTQPQQSTSPENTTAVAESKEAASTSYTAEEIAAETARLNAWFEEKYEYELMQSPLTLMFLGRTERQGEIDDFSQASVLAGLERGKGYVKELQENFDYNKLTDDAKISYDLWVYSQNESEAAFEFAENAYVFEQMQAVHNFFPQIFITFHRVSNEQDVDNYIQRIGGSAAALDELIKQSKAWAKKGVRPPYFAFESVIKESQTIISGAPFDEGGDSALWADAKKKVAALVEQEVLDQAKAAEKLALIEGSFVNDLKPAYERLIAWQKEDQVNAGKEAKGVSSLPNGQAYYNERLANHTSTSLTADEIHELGLSEVARIRAEMEAIKTQFGFVGELTEFFAYLRDNKDDERLYYANTDEGRQGYIDDATAAINNIESLLPEYFGILPKAELDVRRVEAFREQDGAAQHYFPPALDGSRPGIYYAHLSDMKAMPKRELEVIAYHEGLPGHHMQIAIAQELEGIPTFRTQVNFTAYAEGWALYSEALSKEMAGTFTDPLSDFGRLGSEMWRAIRLVVDTGLHAKGWSEQQAVEYFMANSAAPKPQVVSEIRRYLTIPGQATSYKVGMIKIQQMRANAERILGDKFDIRGFHDTVLGGGSMPMTLLERRVNNWIETQKSA